MKPDDLLKTAVAVIVGIGFVGAALGFDPEPATNLVVTLLVWLLPGAILGSLVAAIVAAITRELPRSLLFGGTTGIVLTVILRVFFWIKVHTA